MRASDGFQIDFCTVQIPVDSFNETSLHNRYGVGLASRLPWLPTGAAPLDEPCQLDTNIHLWRITAHNAVHRCQVAEMLKAPPHHFRAGAVAPAAPHKPAELGDPVDCLAQRRRLCRRR